MDVVHVSSLDHLQNTFDLVPCLLEEHVICFPHRGARFLNLIKYVKRLAGTSFCFKTIEEFSIEKKIVYKFHRICMFVQFPDESALF